jgi:hypothetical protein
MILLALSLLVAVETHALPQPAEDDVRVAAPATAPHGMLEPPAMPPRTAVAAPPSPPDPPDPPDPSAYAETTRMRQIAVAMLKTIAVGSATAIVIEVAQKCAG